MLATLTLLMVSHSPPALVLTQSLRDLMPPPRELLPMLPMAMALDTMASVMLMPTLPSCTEDILATLTLLMGSHSPPALVLTQSLRDLMPPPRELLPMLPSCTEDIL